MSRIKIAVVDDQNLFRESLCALLRTIQGLELILETSSGASFLEKLSAIEELPDIALIDIDMPVMNGIELSRHIQIKSPKTRIIVLSVHDDERLIAQMIEEGAQAYLAKNCDRKELELAIKSVHQNGFYMNRETYLAIQNNARLKGKTMKNAFNIPVILTKREKQVLHFICQEFNTIEIADNLFISTRTVEGHRNNLLLKTGCRNTAGLVLFAVKNKLFHLSV